MEGSTHPPLAQCMQQNAVLLPTLVAMELVEQPVTLMENAGILGWEGERIKRRTKEEEHGYSNN